MKNVVIPPVFVFLSLVLIFLFYFKLPILNVIPFPANLTGILIIIFGFSMMGKARMLFKKYKTNLDFNISSYLVTEGIYSKTRNPMYLGMFLFLLGIAVCFRNLISCIIPFVFLLTIRIIFIPKEENLMTERFGQEYQHYKKSVRRWI
jgi:protein-S-isoprenylcysteine O-methyltransferase Ste14